MAEALHGAAVTAVTVADRGPGSNSDSSPNIWPGPEDRQQVLAPVRRGAAELHLALGHDVEPVPESPSLNSTSPRRILASAIDELSAWRPRRRVRGRAACCGDRDVHRCVLSSTRTTQTPRWSRSQSPAWPRRCPDCLAADRRRAAASYPVTMPAKPPELCRRLRSSRTAMVRRARRIDRILAETYPDAASELDFDSPWQLLIVTVLSAQTTDKRVNAVSPTLFARYPGPEGAGGRRPGGRRADHRATGLLPRQDPVDHEDRRGASSSGSTARCPAGSTTSSRCRAWAARRRTSCSGNAFGVPGITVDTHVGRLARRFGWTTQTDPVKAEHEIGALFPKRDWTMLSHHLIWHGRRCCHARSPACGACPVARLCPSYGEGPTDPEVAAKLLRLEGRA